MKWRYKLERRFGRYAISNLMLYITSAMVVVFGLQYFTNYDVYGALSLWRHAIAQGEVWRLITFLAVPSSGGIFGTLLYLYFTYFIGISLEDMLGSFQMNLYYLCGVLTAIISMVLLGYGTNYYLNLTLFLAYAYLNPNQEFLLFFVLPIKAKYLAMVDWVLILVTFIGASWAGRLGIVLAILNFFLFFGADLWRYIRNQISWFNTRRNFRRGTRDNMRYH